MKGLDVLVGRGTGDPERDLRYVRSLIDASADPAQNAVVGMGPFEAYLLLMAVQIVVNEHADELGEALHENLLDVGHQLQHAFSGQLFDFIETGWHRESAIKAGEIET